MPKCTDCAVDLVLSKRFLKEIALPTLDDSDSVGELLFIHLFSCEKCNAMYLQESTEKWVDNVDAPVKEISIENNPATVKVRGGSISPDANILVQKAHLTLLHGGKSSEGITSFFEYMVDKHVYEYTPN